MAVPYVPNSAILIGTDLIGASGGTPPQSGQNVSLVKLDVGSGGLSSPVAGFVPTTGRRGTKNFGQITASGNGQVLAANSGRIDATFYNNGSATIWLGASGVALSGGFPLLATAALQDTSSQDAWYFSMLSGTTTDLRYLEVS